MPASKKTINNTICGPSRNKSLSQDSTQMIQLTTYLKFWREEAEQSLK